MRFILLFGPPAVGKMTVGQALAERTGYRLFHNHMTIDLVTEVFGLGAPSFHRLVTKMRKMVIFEAARSGLPGLIFTYVWGLNLAEDTRFVESVVSGVRQHGGDCWFVELVADADERVRRNRTENRRRHKPKMPLDLVEKRILSNHAPYVLNTGPDWPLPLPERHFRLDTTGLTPAEAAERIEAELHSAASQSGP